MVVALTFTSALALIMLRRDSPLTLALQRWYAAGLSRIVHRPRGAYATFAALTLIALLVVPQLGESLFSSFREPNFLEHFVTVPGTSASEEQRMVLRLSQELRAIPGVRSFGSHIGQAFQGEEVAGVNFGENWVEIDPDADRDKTVAAISTVVHGYPGLYRDVQTY